MPADVLTRWAEILFGFVLGLVGGLFLDTLRDRRKASHIRNALTAEVHTVRSQCVAALWDIAESSARITPQLAELMYELIRQEPLASFRLSEDVAKIKLMAGSQEACDAENRHHERALYSPSSFAMPLFSPEVLGYVSTAAARALVSVYYGVPGINRICEELQEYVARRPTLGAEQRERLDRAHLQNVKMLEGFLTDHLQRCDLALSVLERRKSVSKSPRSNNRMNPTAGAPSSGSAGG